MSDMKTIVSDAARRYGVDPDVAVKIATIESGLNPQNQNPRSSAGGLFQFIDSTWGRYGGGKNKYDPYANADAGARFISDNMAGLKRSLGRDPTPGEIYMAHQQGLGGALNILRDPNRLAVEAVGSKAVSLNLPGSLAGSAGSITAGEFAKLWDNKLNGVKSAPLISGGIPSNSLRTDSTFQVSDTLNPEVAPITQGEVAPNTFVSDAVAREEEKRAEAEADANSPGLLEGAGLAIQNNWSIAAPFRALGYQAPDPDFRLTEDNLKVFARDIPDQLVSEFSDAVSEDHAEAIRNRILKQMETDRKLASMGTTGVALQVGASLLDPGAIAATAAIGAATGGLGLPAALAARFGKLGTIGLGMAEGVAGNLATDIPLMMTNPTMKAADLKYSVASGVLMGGAFSAFRKASPMLAAENAQIDEIADGMKREALNEGMAVASPGSSAGAAQALRDPTYRSDDFDNVRLWKQVDKNFELVMGRARFDLSAQLMKSENPMVRSLGNYLVENAVGNKKGKVTVISASETQRRLQKVAGYQWSRAYGDQWDKYKARKKIGLMSAAEEQRKFSEQVTAWQRAKGIEKDAFDPEVKAAGAQFDRIMKDWWAKAREEGITRSEFGVEGYVPRIPHLENARSKVRQFSYDRTGNDSRDGLTTLFTASIRKAQPQIDEKLARKMGYAMVDRMNKLSAGQEVGAARALSGDDLDDFRAFLNDSSTFSEDEINEAIGMLTKSRSKDSEAGGTSRLQHRVLLDENHSMVLRDRDGVPREVSIKDFYVNDANTLMHIYNRNMSGQIALARVRIPHPENPGEWLVDGIRNQSDFNRLIEQVKGVGNEATKDGKKVTTSVDADNLTFAYNAISGIPNYNQTSDWARFLRMTRDYNFARLMGQVGFSQIPEIGRVASQAGVKAFMAGMPSFRQMIQAARKGTIDDALGHELDAIGAFGTDFPASRFHLEADDMGVPVTLKSNSMVSRAVDAIDPKLHKLNRAVTVMSGMAPINAVFQRWASRAMAVKFVQMAKFGDKVNMDRMKLLGLDEGDLKLIFSNINAHATFKGGVQKAHALEALGTKNWDGKAVAAFESAIYRASRNMILENDVGQFAKWMSTPLGATVLQFRSFAIGAWTRGLMQGINMHDMQAGMGLLAATFLGALTYAGQTHLNLAGDPDREKKLRERLSYSNLGLAGFQRTSESSILPIGVDAVAGIITGETLFDYRSSGLKSNVSNLGGNPTADLFDKAYQGIQGVTTAIGGDDYSRLDAGNLWQTLPGQRIVFGQWFFNWLASGLNQREFPE